MDKKTDLDLAKYRLEQAKESLTDAELLYRNKRYKSANNRAYYSIFYSVRAVLTIERTDFKRHKDVIGYFNQHYVKTEIFPREIGKRISEANRIREDSDYDDEFIVKQSDTAEQIDTAKRLIELVEKYIYVQ